jgi:hypothetical protein
MAALPWAATGAARPSLVDELISPTFGEPAAGHVEPTSTGGGQRALIVRASGSFSLDDAIADTVSRAVKAATALRNLVFQADPKGLRPSRPPGSAA